MVPDGNFLFIHLRRLISGILSIVLSLVILLQACAVGMRKLWALTAVTAHPAYSSLCS